jgi:hypothetical protein
MWDIEVWLLLCELTVILIAGMQDTLGEVHMAPWLGVDSFFH